MAVTQARKASDFYNSIGVNIHVGYDAYADFPKLKATLLDIGIGHVRDGGRYNYPKLRELGAAGIKILAITNPYQDATVPNSSYYITDTSDNKMTVSDVVSALGANILSGIESINEIDLNVWKYKWEDGTPVSTDRASDRSWIKYIDKYVRDMSATMKADSNCTGLEIIGAALGGTYTFDGKNPMLPIGSVITSGNGHYYENAGNAFNDGQTYIGINRYYGNTSFPGNWAGRDLKATDPAAGEDNNSALYRACYEQPYSPAPMQVTECGWSTGYSPYSISYKVHGKYVPRLFAEYFRLGFKRSYWYEFLDQGSNKEGEGDRELSFGLVNSNYNYKPGAVQLKALIGVIKESVPDTRSTIGSLDYTLAYTMPTGYTRSNFVKQVLLQKANGNFVLIVYHNIANADISGGGIAVDINHPSIDATLSFPKSYKLTALTLRDDAVAPTPVYTTTSAFTFKITDTVTVIEIADGAASATPALSPTPTPTTAPTPSPITSTTPFTDAIGFTMTVINSTSGYCGINLYNTGADIWESSDSFTFDSKPETKVNASIEAKVGIPSKADTWSKSGLMYRADKSSDAAYYALIVLPDGKLIEQYRSTKGAGTAFNWLNQTTSASVPYFKIVKTGDSCVGYWKRKKADVWTKAGGATVVLGSAPEVGFALTSHNPSVQANAYFTEWVFG